MVNEKIEIDAEDVEYMRERILKAKWEVIEGHFLAYDRPYLLGLLHSIPYSLLEQDIHLRNLKDSWSELK